MRGFLARFAVVLLFWFIILDLFIGRTGHQFLWTLIVIGAYLLAEGANKLALWLYLRGDSKNNS